MEAYIVDAIRTPIGRGRADGALHSIHPVDLLAAPLAELVKRNKFNPEEIEDVVAGCVTPIGEQGACIGRLAALKAGFPITTPGVQINRFCGSGQQAVHFAAQAIRAGDMDLAIGCGVESMSRVAMGSDASLSPEFRRAFPFELLHQGQSAEMIAMKWGLTRPELDEFAMRSHRLAAEAAEEGWTASELLPIANLTGDEGIRRNVDPAKMAALPTVFQAAGCVTAGNSSQISDGAAAVLLASGEKAGELGLRKRARIVAQTVVGSDPVLMLTGPIDATRKVLERAGLRVWEIDAFEINEAFACVPLVWMREIQPDPALVNVQGGAIAHGHPLGATGAVLLTKLVNILERTGGRFGLQTMCIGFGMATATIIERVG